MNLDKPEHIAQPPVRERQARRGAVIAVRQRVSQHREGAVEEQLLDVFGQFLRLLEYVHQQAFDDAELARLPRYRKAGGDVVTNALAEHVGRNHEMKDLEPGLLIGLAFHRERCHRLRDREVARPGDAAATRVGHGHGPALDEPQHRHVGCVLPDMRPGALEEETGPGAQTYYRAGTHRLLVGTHVDDRSRLDRVVTQVVLLALLPPEGLLALLVIAHVECEQGFGHLQSLQLVRFHLHLAHSRYTEAPWRARA